MIVDMKRTFVVARRSDRQSLLENLRDLGVLHIEAVDPNRAVADDVTLRDIDRLERAIQILTGTEPAGSKPQLDPLDAADEVLELDRKAAEGSNRLTVLYRQIEALEPFGDLRIEQLEALRQAGLNVGLYAIPAASGQAPAAECVQVVGQRGDGKTLYVAASRGGEIDVLDDAEPIEWPERDRPSLREEAAEIDRMFQRVRTRQAELAHQLPAMQAKLDELYEKSKFVAAMGSGMEHPELFAVQGWVPAERAESLAADLEARGLPAGVSTREPTEEELPPTQVRYPGWVRPIKALFDILGTVPGYREMDLSPFFMIALPIFAAMLIGDAGYGAIFTLVGLLGYGKISGKAGKPAAQLVMVFALVTLAWGLLNGNVFGVTPSNFVNEKTDQVEGFGKVLAAVGLLWRKDATVARNLIIQISFIFGTIHLVTAHLRAALAVAPRVQFLAELGWAGFLGGMLGVVWLLFFPDQTWMPNAVMGALLGGGALLVVLFSFPSRNPFKMIGMGVMSNLLPMISAFSDTMSYIRLMAVGLASFYIAVAFNNLAVKLLDATWWMLPFTILILVFAHALNIALGLIAIFAHGVRLNMLEFSSNAGVQWVGYPYDPFSKSIAEGEA